MVTKVIHRRPLHPASSDYDITNEPAGDPSGSAVGETVVSSHIGLPDFDSD